MNAIALAAHQIRDGADIMVGGGVESISLVQFAPPRPLAADGRNRALDEKLLAKIPAIYMSMIETAEIVAERYGVSREAQDAFAIASLSRAQAAISNGSFAAEIVPVQVTVGKAQKTIVHDEQPPKAKPEKIASLKPAFREGGTVTAANSSSISDGAAALLLMRQSEAHKRGLQPLAVIRGHAAFADEPGLFPEAPVGAIRKLMSKTGWNLGDVDLFEINEAFAVVSLITMSKLEIPHDKVNIHGGACALGHPIGASGARILVTLLSALRQKGLKRGVAAICIGGGEATAMAVECLY